MKTEMDFRDLNLLGESNSLSQFGDDNTHADDKPKTSDEFNNSFEIAPRSMGQNNPSAVRSENLFNEEIENVERNPFLKDPLLLNLNRSGRMPGLDRACEEEFGNILSPV